MAPLRACSSRAGGPSRSPVGAAGSGPRGASPRASTARTVAQRCLHGRAGRTEIRAGAGCDQLDPAEPDPDLVLLGAADPGDDLAGRRRRDGDPPLGEVRLAPRTDRVAELSGHFLGDPHHRFPSGTTAVIRRPGGPPPGVTLNKGPSPGSWPDDPGPRAAQALARVDSHPIEPRPLRLQGFTPAFPRSDEKTGQPIFLNPGDRKSRRPFVSQAGPIRDRSPLRPQPIGTATPKSKGTSRTGSRKPWLRPNSDRPRLASSRLGLIHQTHWRFQAGIADGTTGPFRSGLTQQRGPNLGPVRPRFSNARQMGG